jgi:hypothetical protein
MTKAYQSVVVCSYRVRAGSEQPFVELLKAHWPTLFKLELVHEQPRMLLRRRDSETTSCFIEIFAWKDKGFEIAHQHPEVLALWEPMEQLCEARNGQPAVEFPHYSVVSL